MKNWKMGSLGDPLVKASAAVNRAETPVDKRPPANTESAMAAPKPADEDKAPHHPHLKLLRAETISPTAANLQPEEKSEIIV